METGEAELEFARVGTVRLTKKFLTTRNPAPLRVPKSVGFGGSSTKPITMPSWLSEEDVQYYASKLDQTGGLNYYLAMDLNWTGVQIKVHVKFVVGDLDLTYNTSGVKEYMQGGGVASNEMCPSCKKRLSWKE